MKPKKPAPKLPPFKPCRKNGCIDGRVRVFKNGAWLMTACACLRAWRGDVQETLDRKTRGAGE